MISKRAREIGLSPTLGISALAAELRAAGGDVLDFSAGQPDFDTPDNVKRAGREAIDANRTRYTANQGLLELREAIAAYLSRHRGVDYAPDEILVSTGAKASLYFACMAMLDPGDEVLIPAPYWVSYPEQVRLAGGVPRFVPTAEDEGFKLTVDRLREATSERTRMLILNYPSNPTGACYSADELAPLARLSVERGIVILADEIYSRLLYDGRGFSSVAALGDEVRQATILIDGMSKSYAMTGWRIGFAAAGKETISAMARIQSHATSNAVSISQWASLEALRGPQQEIERRTGEFERRRDEIVRRLRSIPGVGCVAPEGSFYAFPNVAAYMVGEIDSGDALARRLLERARVAVVPGEAFGAPGHMRLSFACSLERIREGMDRIEEALGELGDA
jgi:aspartate aminotransferase